MDPITGAVVAAVLFAFSIPFAIIFIPILFGLIDGAVARSEDIGFGLAIVGYLVAFGWAAFAFIQVILQIVRIVQLIT